MQLFMRWGITICASKTPPFSEDVVYRHLLRTSHSKSLNGYVSPIHSIDCDLGDLLSQDVQIRVLCRGSIEVVSGSSEHPYQVHRKDIREGLTPYWIRRASLNLFP